MADPLPERRPYRLSPGRFVVGLLAVLCLLWLSQRFQWFGFNHHKGWTVLFAVAATGMALALMLLWWSACLLFHSRFQFGIRTLLASVLACSTAFGWLAAEMKRARQQAETVQWIKSSDRRAALNYDWQRDAEGDLRPWDEQQPPEPEWLRKVLGDDFFSAVTVVAFHAKTMDAGLDHVSDLKQLRWLILNNCKITDAGLRNLRDLPGLERLQLMGANITDVGMEYLKGFAHLRELYLSCTQIRDAGIERLRGFAELRRLDLDGDRITDAGVEHLSGMTQLEELYLSDTKITDAGLERLKGLTRLRVLGLRNTKVTDAGVKRLQQALPGCQLLTNVPILEPPRHQ